VSVSCFLDVANPYEIVAICDGTTVDTSANTPITISQDYLTLSCEGSNCIMESDGSGRNLAVEALSTSIVGIEFVGGVAPSESYEGGGNVLWRSTAGGEGSDQIVDCTFRNGRATQGGNLFMENWTPSTITIQKSSFIGGTADWDGGGAFVGGMGGILVEDCEFTDNAAGDNEWTYGGGLFMATMFGEMAKLDILNTSFNDNKKGAVGVLDSYVLTFSGNSGEGNTPHAASNCTGLSGGGVQYGGYLALNEEYP